MAKINTVLIERNGKPARINEKDYHKGEHILWSDKKEVLDGAWVGGLVTDPNLLNNDTPAVDGKPKASPSTAGVMDEISKKKLVRRKKPVK